MTEIQMKLLGNNADVSKVDEPNKIPFPQSLFRKNRSLPQERYIYMDGKIFPPNINQPNILNNSKYTFISFLPLVLFHQFRYFFNTFFLLIALSQLFDMLKVGFMFTYLAPLLLVLGFTLGKQAYDDLNRKKRDRETNNQVYQLISKTDTIPIMSQDIKIGQIIQVCSNQRVPADMIVLSTTDPQGTVFIRTDQLDGQTDWKLRKATTFTQPYYNNPSSILNLMASIKAQAPKLDIYNFQGLLKIETTSQCKGSRQGLNLQNTLWGNCFLANGKAMGIVIYTGRQMRSVMNTGQAEVKIGRTDLELNYLSKILFIFMVILALIIVLSGGFGEYWLLDLFRQILLLSSIIPISLRVNLDFSKIVFAYKINHDKHIPDTIVRNSQIPQQLGRIQYILSDKTGTLTQNQMIFKKLSISGVGLFVANQQKLLTKIIKKNYEQSQGPMKDIQQKVENLNLLGKKYKSGKRDKYFITRDFITCLAICHNVTPSVENDVKVYQASSPDEIALVKIAESLNLLLMERGVKDITLKNPLGNIQKFKILAIFPFTSTSKRMGILVEHEQTNRIIFYLKGADSVMKDKISETLRGFLLDQCEDLSREGLRTLVLSQKYLTEKQYIEWKKQYDQANSNMTNRQQAIGRVVEKLQQNMQLLGVTAVQDKLQQNIQQCLIQFRNAGINIWMITGDKVQTAICIGISAGFKSPTQDIYIIKEQMDTYNLKHKLNQYSTKTNTILVIDGISLTCALRQNARFFYTVACEAPAVICCRVSPTQKAVLTQGVRQHTGKIVLGIGDGGNDVGMIQMADVGIGIIGKQGKQAALASDFSIEKFKYLSKLVLWHGRLAYKNTSIMAQFVIHRGLIISIIQCIFSLVFYSVAIPIYNGYLMLGYTTIYTMLPVMCIIFDEDVDEQKVQQFPQLYQTLQKGRQLNLKTFLIWVWKSIYQGAIIMIVSFWLFQDTFILIVTITFSALIISELLNINTVLTKLNKIVCISQIFTLIIYMLSIILFKDVIDVSSINFDFIKKVAIIVILSWGPLHLLKILRIKIDPTENQKIMKSFS